MSMKHVRVETALPINVPKYTQEYAESTTVTVGVGLIGIVPTNM